MYYHSLKSYVSGPWTWCTLCTPCPEKVNNIVLYISFRLWFRGRQSNALYRSVAVILVSFNSRLTTPRVTIRIRVS